MHGQKLLERLLSSRAYPRNERIIAEGREQAGMSSLVDWAQMI
jgi:hypothetical protein